MNDFSEWLEKQLKDRGWSRADLARKSGISAPQITRIMNREQNPGRDSLESLSHALHIPINEIYKIAGILPDIPDLRESAEQILGMKLGELSDEELDDLLIYIEFIQAKRGKKSKPNKREGETPPELIK